MEKVRLISKVFVTGSFFALVSTSAFAHSGHDFSKLPMKWEFTKITKAKIENFVRRYKYH